MRPLTVGLFVCVAMLAAQPALAEDAVKAPAKAPVKKEPARTPPPEVDEDFLEFLANWDSEDETWNEYMASLAKDSKPKDAGRKEPAKPVQAGK